LHGHWPKIIKVFLLLFVHKKKFLLFILLFKIIFPFFATWNLRFFEQKATQNNFITASPGRYHARGLNERNGRHQAGRDFMASGP
jgi:hypothetical protein